MYLETGITSEPFLLRPETEPQLVVKFNYEVCNHNMLINYLDNS